jgi:hypothetical protein
MFILLNETMCMVQQIYPPTHFKLIEIVQLLNVCIFPIDFSLINTLRTIASYKVFASLDN